MLTLFQNLESKQSSGSSSSSLDRISREGKSIQEFHFALLSGLTSVSFLKPHSSPDSGPFVFFLLLYSCKVGLQATLRAKCQLFHRTEGRGSISKMVQQSIFPTRVCPPNQIIVTAARELILSLSLYTLGFTNPFSILPTMYANMPT